MPLEESGLHSPLPIGLLLDTAPAPDLWGSDHPTPPAPNAIRGVYSYIKAWALCPPLPIKPLKRRKNNPGDSFPWPHHHGHFFFERWEKTRTKSSVLVQLSPGAK